jgi:hypothetical protein
VANGSSCVRTGAGTHSRACKTAGQCAPFRHPIDGRQAWRLLELGRSRRRSHGPREHESAWSSLRARLAGHGGSRRHAYAGEQSKIDGTFNPAWLPASIREAHKLGLHVHGHVPAGIRPIDAINDGYDEITHINWVMMQAMPDSAIPVSNGIMRFEGPGRYAKDVDLEGAPIRAIIGAMVS